MITGPLADLVLAALALWGIGGWSHPIHTAYSTRDDAEAAWAFAAGDACWVVGNANFGYWPAQTQQDIVTHEVGHCLGLFHHPEADCAIAAHVMCAQVEQLASTPTALDMLKLREHLGRYGVWARPLQTVWPTQHRLALPMVGR